MIPDVAVLAGVVAHEVVQTQDTLHYAGVACLSVSFQGGALVLLLRQV